jgi:hypothetical protein
MAALQDALAQASLASLTSQLRVERRHVPTDVPFRRAQLVEALLTGYTISRILGVPAPSRAADGVVQLRDLVPETGSLLMRQITNDAEQPLFVTIEWNHRLSPHLSRRVLEFRV